MILGMLHSVGSLMARPGAVIAVMITTAITAALIDAMMRATAMGTMAAMVLVRGRGGVTGSSARSPGTHMTASARRSETAPVTAQAGVVTALALSRLPSRLSRPWPSSCPTPPRTWSLTKLGAAARCATPGRTPAIVVRGTISPHMLLQPLCCPAPLAPSVASMPPRQRLLQCVWRWPSTLVWSSFGLCLHCLRTALLDLRHRLSYR